MDRLRETAFRFFATDDRPLPPRRTTFADLKFLFGDAAPEEGVRYLGLGLRGSGLQGGSLEYLLDAKNLRLAVSLPWDRGYGDPEEERASVENAFQLVNLCLTFRPEAAWTACWKPFRLPMKMLTPGTGCLCRGGGTMSQLVNLTQTSPSTPVISTPLEGPSPSATPSVSQGQTPDASVPTPRFRICSEPKTIYGRPALPRRAGPCRH